MSSFSVGGLSTGINYNDLISKLMEVQRQPITILENKKSSYNDKITQYNSLSSKLSTLKSVVDKLKTSTNFYSKSVSVGDSAVVEATVTNAAATGNYSITVAKLASEENETHSGVAESTSVINSSGSDKVFQYTYGGTQSNLTVESGTTLEGLRDLINYDAGNPGVTATIVNDGVGANPYRLIIKGNETGATNTVTIDAGTTLDGTDSTADFSATAFTETKTAYDADFTIDGLQIKRSSNAITDVITGMTINLKKEGEPATTVTVTADRETIKDQINSFISAYNDVVDLISSSMAYDSTTGKSGVLSGEGTSRNIQNKLRNIISSTVSGQPDDMNVLAQLGITTDSKTGKLSVNSSALDTKLASDLDDVATLFTNSTDGIGNQFYNYINTVTSTVDGSITIRESGLKSVIDNIDKTIKNMEYRLDKTEEDLVRRFTSLESLVSSYNSIGNYLSSVSFSTKA
jgi:flagellar hook-associated protein 2